MEGLNSSQSPELSVSSVVFVNQDTREDHHLKQINYPTGCLNQSPSTENLQCILTYIYLLSVSHTTTMITFSL